MISKLLIENILLFLCPRLLEVFIYWFGNNTRLTAKKEKKMTSIQLCIFLKKMFFNKRQQGGFCKKADLVGGGHFSNMGTQYSFLIQKFIANLHLP